MLKRIVLALVLIMAIPAAGNAQEFGVGVAVGSLLSRGNSTTQYLSAVPGIVLYTATDEVMKDVDMLSARMAATRSCFHKELERNKTGMSLNELFAELTKGMPKKERIILQVVRVISPQEVGCAAIWFIYIEK